MSLENFKYNLQELKKCDQYWDEMIPRDNGRHCSECNRTIVDFSGMTFAEIALYMSASNRPVCGYYLPEQVTKMNKPLSRISVALGLSTFIATASLAEPFDSVENTVQSTSFYKDGYSKDINVGVSGNGIKVDTIVIYGRVVYFDSTTNSNKPVSFASIIVKGKSYGVTTDMEGNFKLQYQMSDTGIAIVITSVGFMNYEVTDIVAREQKDVDLGTIMLRRWEGEMSEFIVSVKKRRALDRFWRKLTKPFRS